MASNPLAPDQILKQAANTLQQRGVDYDGKGYQGGERSMAHTVEIFNVITGLSLTEEQGWLFMVSLKMARSMVGKPKLDTHVDFAAYSALRAECQLSQRVVPIVPEASAITRINA